MDLVGLIVTLLVIAGVVWAALTAIGGAYVTALIILVVVIVGVLVLRHLGIAGPWGAGRARL